LKVRMRCGCSWCACQMRCTERSAMPIVCVETKLVLPGLMQPKHRGSPPSAQRLCRWAGGRNGQVRQVGTGIASVILAKVRARDRLGHAVRLAWNPDKPLICAGNVEASDQES
jgi:hypothetical protein